MLAFIGRTGYANLCTGLDETPIYYASLALYPGYSWRYFDKIWKHRPDWVEAAKKMVREVWEKEYSLLDIMDLATSIPKDNGKRPADEDFFDPFAAPSEKKRRLEESQQAEAQTLQVSGDEYDAWLADKADKAHPQDVFQYWYERRHKYPRLSRMALDFLTIPAMSSECERLFSSAGRMMTQQRTSLAAAMVSMCQALRSWYRSGIARDMDTLLVSIQEEGLLKTLARWDEMSEQEKQQQIDEVQMWLEEPTAEYGEDKVGEDYMFN